MTNNLNSEVLFDDVIVYKEDNMGEKFEHGYALIIGVDENMIPRLELPVVSKDVQALHDVLIHPQRCGYLPENVRLLKGNLATRDNIFDSLQFNFKTC